MKKMKRIFAFVMAMALALAMTLTAAAKDQNGTKVSSNDTVNVQIQGIVEKEDGGYPDVKLYQIARGNYSSTGDSLINYAYTENVTAESIFTKVGEGYETSAAQVNAIVLAINEKSVVPLATYTGSFSENGIWIANVPAGVYIAVITGDPNHVYNPILLTATYGDNGVLTGGEVNVETGTFTGSTGVAKMSTPSVDKKITAGTEADGDKGTVGIGSVVDYELSPKIPTFPSNATDKTIGVTDKMSDGLTFDYASLTVTVGGATLDRSENGNTFTNSEGAVVATAYNTVNGFRMIFTYDELTNDNGSVNQPVITYKAVVNANAVVGNPGNPNDARFYWTNDPNGTPGWTTPDKDPQEAENLNHKKDSETVYTYQLAFSKTGADNDGDGTADPLRDAIFGIYSDENCTQLIDEVTTNENGYAVSTKVKAGTYFIKELKAPDGYSLNTDVFHMEATWTTATSTVTGTVTNVTYTSEKPNDEALQVGWLKGNQFYEMDEFTAEDAAASKGAIVPAYINYSTSTTTSSVTTVTNSAAGAGTVNSLMDGDGNPVTAIPNTKLSALPSTGGIGTTIFTIVGVIVMCLAAAMFFVTRRKGSRKA